MALTKEQRRELNQLSEYLKKIEKISIENKIDLDVFMTDYKGGRIQIYATEKISIPRNADQRKNIFEKSGVEKSKTTIKTA